MAGWPNTVREAGGLKARPVPGRPPPCPGPSCSGSTPWLSAMTPGSCSSACPVDPGDGAGVDRSGVRGAAVGGEGGAAAARAGAVPAAAAVPGLSANPEAVARGKAETYPSSVGRPPRWGHGLLRRRGRGALGRPRRHDLGAGRADPVVAATGDRFGINLLSAVAAKGKLRFAAYEGGLNGSVFSISAAGCWVTALARCSWSWTVIGGTAPRPSRRSPSRPMGGCGCACGPGRRRS
jgi:hypothetical protein